MAELRALDKALAVPADIKQAVEATFRNIQKDRRQLRASLRPCTSPADAPKLAAA